MKKEDHMADVKIGQWINIKFLIKLKKSASDCLKLLQEVYGENVVSRMRVSEWQKLFATGRENVADDERPGHHVTTTTEQNIVKISEIVRNDRRLSIRMTADNGAYC